MKKENKVCIIPYHCICVYAIADSNIFSVKFDILTLAVFSFNAVNLTGRILSGAKPSMLKSLPMTLESEDQASVLQVLRVTFHLFL